MRFAFFFVQFVCFLCWLESSSSRTWEPHSGGIGRAIYGLCERTARAAGVVAFECYASLNAEEFYRALDFKRIREIDLELQPRIVFRAVLMRRDL